ncbi:MAG: ferrochelatase, partial [Deltaproteobacteria bacterium]
IAAIAARLAAALEQVPAEWCDRVHVAFTAHSISEAMAGTCRYQVQLRETCRLTAAQLRLEPSRWQLVYQSRSGRPEDPWLGPDICDHLRTVQARGVSAVVIMPIGFLSDHIEVLYDLDCEARHVCVELGLAMVRAGTVGTHPLFVQMIRELIEERLPGSETRVAIGEFPAWPDVCPEDCCPAPPASTHGRSPPFPPLFKGGEGGVG